MSPKRNGPVPPEAIPKLQIVSPFFKVGWLLSSRMIGDTNSANETAIDGPPFPPNPKLKVADEHARLQGTTKPPRSLLLIAPTPLMIGLRILSGTYVMVVPLSKMTGRARLFCDIVVFPVASVKETDDNDTVKSV